MPTTEGGAADGARRRAPATPRLASASDRRRIKPLDGPQVGEQAGRSDKCGPGALGLPIEEVARGSQSPIYSEMRTNNASASSGEPVTRR